MIKKKETRRAFDNILNLIPVMGIVGMTGGLMKMFGLGNTQDKRTTAKGVLDLVCDDYENTIREMEIVNKQQEQEIEKLKMELGVVEESLRALTTKAKKKKVKKKKR